MYGSIFRMRVKSDQEQAVVDLFDEWETKRKAQARGSIGGLLMKPDRGSGEFIGVALFEDKPSYRANADDPEQSKWYERLRKLLEDDPDWEDGEYVAGDVR